MILARDQRVIALGDDGRVLHAAWYKTPPEGAVIVDRADLPEGNVAQYKYVNGEFIFDPMPEMQHGVPEPTTDERIAALEQMAAEQDAALIELAALIGGGA